MGSGSVKDLPEAIWKGELAKEAPADEIEKLLRKIFPDALKIVNIRDRRVSGTDWILEFANFSISLDDKTDKWLGYTGNISLDQRTISNKDRLQLFVNPDFPGKYLLIDNNKLNVATIMIHGKPHQMQTEGYKTTTYIIAIKHIENAIVKAKPSVKWFKRKRRRKKK